MWEAAAICLVIVVVDQYSHPSVHNISLFFFSSFFFQSFLSHILSLVNFVWEKSHSRKCSVSTEIWPAKWYRKFLYLFCFFPPLYLIWWEREGCLTVTYHILCVCVCGSGCAYSAPAGQQWTCAPLLISQACFPGLNPLPSSLPFPPPYYYGTMWTMAFNLLFSLLSFFDSLTVSLICSTGLLYLSELQSWWP